MVGKGGAGLERVVRRRVAPDEIRCARRDGRRHGARRSGRGMDMK